MPREFIDYVHDWIDSVLSWSGRNLWRYILPVESTLWVAYDRFKLAQSPLKKLSMTVSPVLPMAWMLDGYTGYTYVILRLGGEAWDYARAVSYTNECDSEGDCMVTPVLFEVNVFLHHYMRDKGVEEEEANISIEAIRDARVKEWEPVEYTERDWYKLKNLPKYLYGKVRTIAPERILPKELLIRQLAIMTVYLADGEYLYNTKYRAALSYAWDRYWDDMGKIDLRPKYREAEQEYATGELVTEYSNYGYMELCEYMQIHQEFCDKLWPDVADEMRKIIGMFGETADIEVEPPHVRTARSMLYTPRSKPNMVAHELYRLYPSLFRDPHATSVLLRYWYGPVDALVDLVASRQWAGPIDMRLDPDVVAW